jgi:hypothetical protein
LEPLEVTFYLKTPIALGFPWLYLDSILINLKIMDELGERYLTPPPKVENALVDIPDNEIPIKKWKDVYVSSVSIFEPSDVGLQVFEYFKKGEYPFPEGKIRRGSGFFKDFYLRVGYLPVRSIKFYCTCEKDEVERLLRKAPAIGKERNIGFGFVKKVEVREIEHEWGLVKDGLAMRPIPVTYLKKYEDAVHLAYKPPYWRKEHVALCAVPFTRVEL